jgi:serine/threonine-protein kinase
MLASMQAIALLDHPNIWPVTRVGEYDRFRYQVRPWVPGVFLDQLLGQQRPDSSQALRWVRDLALAAQHVHDHGISHCDIKPTNVRVRPDRHVLLTGFECALVHFLPLPLQERSNGMVVGTPRYMAPEQARGEWPAFGPGVDVWALGVTLYEMLTGRQPFQGATVLDTLMALITEEPAAPTSLRPDLAGDLDRVCLRCLAKKPEQRYPSAEALAADLERILAGVPLEEPRPATLTQRLGGWIRGWLGAARA